MAHAAARGARVQQQKAVGMYTARRSLDFGSPAAQP